MLGISFQARIIKATSRELTYVMLGGVTIQYILVFTQVAPPSTFLCKFNFIGFHIAFTVVYAPLLMRTNRIYRIFNAGKKTKTLPSCASPLSQIVITFLLIAVQVRSISLYNTLYSTVLFCCKRNMVSKIELSK